MKLIVCDAGPIIHLYEARCLPLLRHMGNLFLPQRVYRKVQTAIHIEDPWPEWLQVVRLSPHEQKEAGMWQTWVIFMQARQKHLCWPAESKRTGF